jgi:hypothetical protein
MNAKCVANCARKVSWPKSERWPKMLAKLSASGRRLYCACGTIATSREVPNTPGKAI